MPNPREQDTFEVTNRFGDVVQRGTMITVETEGGIESIPEQPITIRPGDRFEATFTVTQSDD